MKTKILLSIMAIGLIVTAFGQKGTMELTFTAENNGQYVPFDSILIENLTQGVDTTLYAPDTVLVLDYITSIGNDNVIADNSFLILQNYPNPFKEKTEVNLYLPEKEPIIITVRDILGRELAQYKNTLNRGNHFFAFYPDNEMNYLLTVTGKQTSRTIKMLKSASNTSNGGKCRLVYTGYEDKMMENKSSKDINNFVFNIGDELKYTGYTDVEEIEVIDAPTGSQTFTLQFDGWTPCPGMSAVTDIDGNIYNTVQIGDQCWMKENLRTTTYNNNTPISNVPDENAWSDLTTEAYVWFDNDISWKGSYGALYNWYAVDDVNGLCPTGWHVSTDDEWTGLADFVGGTEAPHGNELKSCRQVNSPLGEGCITIEHPRWNAWDNTLYGTDDYDFSGLPAGERDSYSSFYFTGEVGYWWTSTEYSSTHGWNRFLQYEYAYIGEFHPKKKLGLSVRCIKD